MAEQIVRHLVGGEWITEVADDGAGSVATHTHTGADITSGTVADARIDPAIARDTEVATATAAGVLAAPKVAAQTVVIFGDSITGNNNVANGAGANGYWTHARMRLGQRFLTVNNAGVGGNTTTQMLARIQADVLAYNPGWVIVQGGGNDVAAAASAATITANLQAIYTACRGIGATVCATTVLPSGNFDTAPEKLVVQQVNEWIRTYATATAGIVLCDWYAAIANPATYTAATGLTSDGVHPSQRGAYYLGQLLAAALAPVSHAAEPLPLSNAEVGLVCPNPRMVGNTSGVADSTTFGPGAQTGFLTKTKVARTDNIQGEWQQVVAASATGGWYLQQQATPLVDVADTVVAAGDRVYATCEAEIDAGATMVGVAGEVPVCLTVINQDSAGAPSMTDSYASSSDGTYSGPIPTGRLVLRTPNFLLAAAASRLFVRVTFGFNGTARLGRMQIYKTSATGVYG